MKRAALALAFGALLAACGKSDLSEEPTVTLLTPIPAAPSPPPRIPSPTGEKIAAENSTPAELVRSCFNAIRAGDWAAYSGLTITMSEVAAPADGAAKGAKFGELFKPQEERRHRMDFDRAMLGGPGQIDFHASEFGGVEPIEKLKRIAASPKGAKIGTFAVKLKQDGQVHPPSGLGPSFVVVSWEGKFRLVALRFNPPKP